MKQIRIYGIPLLFSFGLSLAGALGLTYLIQALSPIPLDESFSQTSAEYIYKREPILQRKELIAVGKELGLDQPIFYFSISPSFMPSDLHEVLPIAERNALFTLARKTQSGTFFAERRKDLLRILPESDPKIQRDIILILRESDLRIWVKRWNDLVAQTEVNLPPLPSELKAKDASWIPIYRWHGRANRFHSSLWRLCSGNWGDSWVDDRAVRHKIGQALPPTFFLMSLALILLFLSGIGLGLAWYMGESKWWASWTKQLSYLLTVVPLFWLATLTISLFSAGGVVPLFRLPSAVVMSDLSMVDFIVPLLVLWLGGIGYIARFFEDRLRQEMEEPYIHLAISRQFSRWWVIRHYAIPNALLAMISLVGGSIPLLISGSLVIEVVFNLPGMGYLLWKSILQSDVPLIITTIALLSVIGVIGRWLADRISEYLDPRTEFTKV